MLMLCYGEAVAGPYIPAGDAVLRHDIQQLADAGFIKGPTTTWPQAWGPILYDIERVDISTLSPQLGAAFARVRNRANWETRIAVLGFNAKASAAVDPARIRGFQNTPRTDFEVAVGAGWVDEWISIEVNVQGVDSDLFEPELRADNSFAGVVLGNWSVGVSTQERWWGPGWDGSLILSDNARPMAAITIDRVFTDRFQSKWLNWIGPWDFSVMFGQMEPERVVPSAQFFGMRVNFRPLPGLEFGLSRSAQWCGDGRPCNSDTITDLFVGNDNRESGGVGTSDEPGNQLAGFDFRWSPGIFGHSVAVYGQFIGEDEAGGFPSRYMGQLGGEWSGSLGNRWSARVFAEFAGTSCQFHESSELFNCAYNHSIYQTGYRYRGRSIGHPAENDARLGSFGLVLVDAADSQWRALIRLGDLNRGGEPDPRNTLTTTKQGIVSFDLSHSRVFPTGVIDFGVGHERLDDTVSGRVSSDSRFYLQWRSSY